MSGSPEERARAVERNVRQFIDRHEGLECVNFEPTAHDLLASHDLWDGLLEYAEENGVTLHILDE
ncbi:MAG: hypothetical protein ACLFWG_00120 [Longimicrobiales bacterium]